MVPAARTGVYCLCLVCTLQKQWNPVRELTQGDRGPSSPSSPHYYTTNKESNSKVSRPYYTSTPSGYPGPRPRCYYSSTPSFLNPITTLSASGEAPLADAAMSVEDPSQRKGRRIVAAGYHSRMVTWIVRSTVADLYRSPTQLHNYLS